MPISVNCPACGKGHKAPDRAAGRTLKCLACGEPMTVPPAEIDPAALLLAPDEPVSTPLPPNGDLTKPESPPEPVATPPSHSYGLAESEASFESPSEPVVPAPKPKAKRPKPDLATLPPLTTDDPPLWRRHLHWLLVLAMIPLAASLLVKSNERDVLDRFKDTLQSASPESLAKFESLDSDATIDDLLGVLPGSKLQGAWLPRNTMAHWGLAAASTALFLVFFMFLASDGSAKPLQVLGVGLFSATIGIGLLLVVQVIASMTEGRVVMGRSVLVIIFYIFKFIAFSYNAASDPDNGFLLSFVGFTLGVGLCEELVKTLPLFQHREESKGKVWRGLFIWGLASGAGFGIAEGILYSGRYYNGIQGPGIYVVRFLSCVALHAIWSGSAAITLYLKRDLFNHIDAWHDWIGPILLVIGVPMILHGLYDTSLKRDMNGVALLVAIASFGWLAYLSSRLYGTDDEAANRAMLAEYKRRRQVVSE
ncbi:PrsW family glutamic-type intramembrane protease [Zavarzinella formosa]|uniref:PrsW family glutamic-type intramembrane protease n=1 Tax=Zavarzinella formosa TaxID=360055 RepID=UPI0002DC2CB8|nr:PrsW family glutamic-type intramembrane protease [Zavarzinella formosa]